MKYSILILLGLWVLGCNIKRNEHKVITGEHIIHDSGLIVYDDSTYTPHDNSIALIGMDTSAYKPITTYADTLYIHDTIWLKK